MCQEPLTYPEIHRNAMSARRHEQLERLSKPSRARVPKDAFRIDLCVLRG